MGQRELTHPVDVAVIGGGVIGCSCALFLAELGFEVTLIERQGLCMSASGMNAGTLAALWARPAMVPYAKSGIDHWKEFSRSFGVECGFAQPGGLKLAFLDHETGTLEDDLARARSHNIDAQILSQREIEQLEPAVAPNIVAALYSKVDGYVDPTRVSRVMPALLRSRGVEVRCGEAVVEISGSGSAYTVTTSGSAIVASRIVLAGGLWNQELLSCLGLKLQVNARVSQMLVTDRMRPVIRCVISSVSDVLSIKQVSNGTILIGGGWQGQADADRLRGEVVSGSIIGNLRLANHAIPRLAETRIVRSWVGMESRVEDLRPVVGRIPGLANAFMIGAIHSGYTIGPFLAKLLARMIGGLDVDLSPFEPARLIPEFPNNELV